MPEQQLNETHKCIEGVEALDSDARHHLAWLGQCSVAQIDTHLSTQTEETCYQVISFEDTMKMHLSYNDITVSGTTPCSFNEKACQNARNTISYIVHNEIKEPDSKNSMFVLCTTSE